MPGPTVRPVLVREALTLRDLRTNALYGALIVSYGTGEFDARDANPLDLIIGDWNEVRAAGLHKPTRFSLDPRHRKQLPWCEEYFVSQEYVRRNNIVAGTLTERQINRLRDCLKRRGLL